MFVFSITARQSRDSLSWNLMVLFVGVQVCAFRPQIRGMNSLSSSLPSFKVRAPPSSMVRRYEQIESISDDASSQQAFFDQKEDDLTNSRIRHASVELVNDKNIILGLLWSITALSALDRVAMSVALVPMGHEYGFSDTVKGSISSLFSVGYGIGILPAGILLSTFSPRIVMSSGVVLWSLATLATPFTAEYVPQMILLPLLLVRACVGAGESLVIPTVQRLLATWTQPEEKSFGLALVFSGFQCGNIAAYLLSPVVMDVVGDWRGLFWVYGVIGFLILVPWLSFAKDVPDPIENFTNMSVPNASAEEKKQRSAMEDATNAFRDAPWLDFARSKGAWAMLLAHCAKNWGLYNTLAWTPTFYAEQYGIGVRDSAWLSVLPSVAGAATGFIAGGLADRILRDSPNVTTESVTQIRKAFQAVGLLGPAAALASLAFNLPESAWVAQFYLMAALALQSFNAAGFEAGNQDKAGPKWAGMLYSVTSLPAVMGEYSLFSGH
jgi:ACS family sodium-dependent inorganic phosphate cotransporter